MVDIAKQVAYWRDGAEEGLAVARDLLDKRRWRHCLFFAHLALEKLLKAFVCRQTQDLAPRTDNLVHLAELAGLTVPPEQNVLLARMNEYQIEGRYPDQKLPPADEDRAREYFGRTEEFFRWLVQRL